MHQGMNKQKAWSKLYRFKEGITVKHGSSILTLSVTAAALTMKSLTDTLICSEKTKKTQHVNLIHKDKQHL